MSWFTPCSLISSLEFHTQPIWKSWCYLQLKCPKWNLASLFPFLSCLPSIIFYKNDTTIPLAQQTRSLRLILSSFFPSLYISWSSGFADVFYWIASDFSTYLHTHFTILLISITTISLLVNCNTPLQVKILSVPLNCLQILSCS